MAMHKVTLRPGVNTTLTPTLNEGGFATGDHIRFFGGLVQKLGGWVRTSLTQFLGICRGMHSWVLIDNTPTLGLGTTVKLYIFELGTFYDVTPVVQTDSPLAPNPFATTVNSSMVTVTDAAFSPAVGQRVILSGAIAVGGLTLNGEYEVESLTSGTQYVIDAMNNATSTAVGGGVNVVAVYLLAPGIPDTTFLVGYGTGQYGAGPYGTGTAAAYATLARVWSIDNWGENMIASPLYGGIYQWVAASGPSTRAVILANAPTINSHVMVAVPAQQVIALGSDVFGQHDPLLIRWTDIGVNTVWSATTTNQAGSYRLPRGSAIIGGIAGPQQNLVWTNEGLWLMQYINQPLIYSFLQIGFGCGLISPLAGVAAAGQVFWMGPGNFYAYTGTVRVLPCTIWDDVFLNANFDQSVKFHAGVNSQFNEVWFFYVSANATEIDSYAKFNWVENTWDGGSLARTSWEDKTVLSSPVATSPSSYLYSHEVGVDDDGAPLASTSRTGYFDLAEGEMFVHFNRMIPDFNIFAGTLDITLYLTDYPGESTWAVGPFNVSPTTQYFTTQGRARQVAMQVRSNVIGGNYRFGAIRHNGRPDGRR